MCWGGCRVSVGKEQSSEAKVRQLGCETAAQFCKKSSTKKLWDLVYAPMTSFLFKAFFKRVSGSPSTDKNRASLRDPFGETLRLQLHVSGENIFRAKMSPFIMFVCNCYCSFILFPKWVSTASLSYVSAFTTAFT